MMDMLGPWVALAATGRKSESMPLAMGWQGAANVDCVTVWFLGWKMNSTVSPTDALIDGGVYSRPFWPTLTWMVVADATAATARTAGASVKRIFVCFVFFFFFGMEWQGRLRYDYFKRAVFGNI